MVFFAGWRPYAIMIAKKEDPAKSDSDRGEPGRCGYNEGERAMNKVQGKWAHPGDGRLSPEGFSASDRVVMPLPRRDTSVLGRAFSA